MWLPLACCTALLVLFSSSHNYRYAHSQATLPSFPLGIQQLFYHLASLIWVPRDETLVTLLMAKHPLNVDFLLHNENDLTSVTKTYLRYKCSITDSKFEALELHKNIAITRICDSVHPITIRMRKEHSYILMLDDTNKLHFNQSLSHCMEFSLNVQFYSGGELNSRSLFIYNFDALRADLKKPSSAPPPPFDRWILVPSAEKFLTKFELPSGNPIGSSNRIELLDSRFVELVKSSSILIRSVLHVALYYKDTDNCTDVAYNPESDLLLVSANAVGLRRGAFTLDGDFHLSLETGHLLFNFRGVFDILARLKAIRNKDLYLCMQIGSNTDSPFYFIGHRVAEIKTAHLTVLRQMLQLSSDTTCTVNDGITKRSVSIAFGLENLALVNPVVCSRPKIFTVYFKGEPCVKASTYRPDGSIGCKNQYFAMGRNGLSVIFEGFVFTENTGSYTFRDDSDRYGFTVDVKVISLPVFTIRDTFTPNTTSNANGEVVLSCSVVHSGTGAVFIEPSIRQVIENGENRLKPWQSIRLDEFITGVLLINPKRMRKLRTRSGNTTNLNVHLPLSGYRVRESGKMLYLCRVEIGDEVARQFGIASYSMQVATYIIPQREPPCSGRSCNYRHFRRFRGGASSIGMRASFCALPFLAAMIPILLAH